MLVMTHFHFSVPDKNGLVFKIKENGEQFKTRVWDQQSKKGNQNIYIVRYQNAKTAFDNLDLVVFLNDIKMVIYGHELSFH